MAHGVEVRSKIEGPDDRSVISSQKRFRLRSAQIAPAQNLRGLLRPLFTVEEADTVEREKEIKRERERLSREISHRAFIIDVVV